MFPQNRIDDEEAARTAHYLAANNVRAEEIYVTLVDTLGVAPHTALGAIARAA